uniref:Uncharacterized protein n=1 Tax=Salix viminalis TaxID=40686 RepID=A0A6N2KW02_SALVM
MSQNEETIRETLFYSFVSNVVKNSILSLPRYEQKSGAAPQLYTPFDSDLVDSELSRSRGSQEGKRTHPCCIWHDDDKRELRLSMKSGLTELLALLCFSLFSYQRVLILLFEIFFVRTEPLAESNPVPQDPISAIHPPCIYAGDIKNDEWDCVTSTSPPMRKDAVEKKGTLLRSAGCVGSPIEARSCLLRRRFLAFSSLWTGAHTGGEQTKRVFRNGKKETTISPLCWTAGANTVVSDQDQEPNSNLDLDMLVVGNRRHLARKLVGVAGGFRDPVENASFMPREPFQYGPDC